MGGRCWITPVEQFDDVGIFLLAEHWAFFNNTVEYVLKKVATLANVWNLHKINFSKSSTMWKIAAKRDHDIYGKFNIFSVKSTFLLKGTKEVTKELVSRIFL